MCAQTHIKKKKKVLPVYKLMSVFASVQSHLKVDKCLRKSIIDVFISCLAMVPKVHIANCKFSLLFFCMFSGETVIIIKIFVTEYTEKMNE